jgi:hypothetical protein
MRCYSVVRWAPLVAAALLVPAAAASQVSVGVGLGPAVPVGHLGEEAGIGFHVQASLGLNVLPVEVRVDGLFKQFTEEDGGWIRGKGGLANVFLPIPAGGVAPYVIAGLGLIHYSDEHGHEEPGVNFGFGIGAGLRFGLGGRSAFIEARYVDGGEDLRSIPITVGIMF